MFVCALCANISWSAHSNSEASVMSEVECSLENTQGLCVRVCFVRKYLLECSLENTQGSCVLCARIFLGVLSVVK